MICAELPSGRTLDGVKPKQERHTIKTCGCGKTYTREEWETLSLTRKHNGVLKFEDGYTYEFRHCIGCASTLAITIGGPAPETVPAVVIPPPAMRRRPISQPPIEVAASAALRISRSDK